MCVHITIDLNTTHNAWWDVFSPAGTIAPPCPLVPGSGWWTAWFPRWWTGRGLQGVDTGPRLHPDRGPTSHGQDPSGLLRMPERWHCHLNPSSRRVGAAHPHCQSEGKQQHNYNCLCDDVTDRWVSENHNLPSLRQLMCVWNREEKTQLEKRSSIHQSSFHPSSIHPRPSLTTLLKRNLDVLGRSWKYKNIQISHDAMGQ